MKKIVNILLALSFLSFSLCAKAQEKKFNYGEVKNGQYLNSFFNLSIDLPKNWVVQTSEADRSTGLETSNADPSKISEANLLSIFKYALKPDREKNPGLSIVVENLQDYPEIGTAEDFLKIVKDLYGDGQGKEYYTFENIEKIVINDRVFYKLVMHISYLQNKLTQVNISTISNGFSVSLISVFENKEEEKILLKSINSLKIKNK